MAQKEKHDIEISEGDDNDIYDRETVERKLNIHYRRLIFHVFVIICCFCILVFFVSPPIIPMYYGYYQFSSMRETVISPIDSILKEYHPKSAKPCVYTTLNFPYENTFICNCKYANLY